MKKPCDQSNEAWLRFLKRKADQRAKSTPRELELYWLAIEFEEATAAIHKKAHAGTPYGALVKEYTPLEGEAVAAFVEHGSPASAKSSAQELLDTMRALRALRDEGSSGAGQGELPSGDLGPTMTPPRPKPRGMDR